MTRHIPTDYPAFAPLPVQRITVGTGGQHMAVHIEGQLLPDRVPLIAVPGYQHNMADFSEFAVAFRQLAGAASPLVLVDLKGRGRSSDRRRGDAYSSLKDAADLAEVTRALGLDRAIFLGQGHGGQVIMALGAARPSLIAGAVLIDAGPVSDPRGLVRLRHNLTDMQGLRSGKGLRTMLRKMLAPDYPDLSEARLDQLAARTHYVDRRKRARSLFDPALLAMLTTFSLDDVLVPQWPLFDALAHAPLLMMRTQLTQQLRRETFDEMMRRRRDSEAYVIEGQGSPALLQNADDVQPIVDFVRQIVGRSKKAA